MKNLKIVGAAVFSLALVAPAMANQGYHAARGLHAPYGTAVAHRIPAQDFDHLDLGIARPTYPSGWGGPYGDGNYPGSVDENMGPPYLAPHSF
jgi:hypothetical protein